MLQLINNKDYLPLTGGTLSDTLFIAKNSETESAILALRQDNIDASKANNNLNSAIYPGTTIRDGSNRILSKVEAKIYPNGAISNSWYLKNYDTAGNSVAQKGISFEMNKSGNLTYTIDDSANFKTAIKVDNLIQGSTWTAVQAKNGSTWVRCQTDAGGGLAFYRSTDSGSTWTMTQHLNKILNGTAKINSTYMSGGTFYLKRRGNVVYCNMSAVAFKAYTGRQTVANIPDGYKPNDIAYGNFNGKASPFAIFNSNGTIQVDGTNATHTEWGSAVWLTDQV